MKFNSLAGAENFFYSFEYYGAHSLWNFLFPTNQPPIPRGVTHGDELLYLFSTGVFNFEEDDWEVARIMSNLWANFVIYGYNYLFYLRKHIFENKKYILGTLQLQKPHLIRYQVGLIGRTWTNITSRLT